MPHNNLTIDFNDASFDESSANNQPAGLPTGIDVDVSFPISDNSTFLSANPPEDFRTSTTNPANSIALMADQSTAGVMQEFLFEFDNSVDHDNDTNTPDVQGLKVTAVGHDASGNDVVTDINLAGTFNNLTDGGTLDVYVNNYVDHDGQAGTPPVSVFHKLSLGAPTANTGDDMAILVGGDTNGANMGDGNDMAMIGVDATSDMTGLYQGGAGFDVLTLVGGVDNGANVDFGQGVKNGSIVDPNSALVMNYGGTGSGLNFFISEFETLELTNNADTIIIGSDTGHGLTNRYDAAYINNGASGSMLELKSGYTDGGMADEMYINADSNIYLSFDFADATNTGISAVFKNNGDPSFKEDLVKIIESIATEYEKYYKDDEEIEYFRKQLKKLQNNLGDFNDISVQLEMLAQSRQDLPRSKRSIAIAAAIGGLVTHLNAKQEEVREDFTDVFAVFASDENIERFYSVLR